MVYDLSLVWCFLGHASLYAVDVFWRGRFGGRSDGGGGGLWGELGKVSPSISCGVYGEKGMLFALTSRS